MGIQDKLGVEDVRFRAFVSYSHADGAIAKKLHRKMEAYKLPKLLRELQSDGKGDGRLGQLFRDRDDLPATLDLSESVKAALRQSRALIVLCSPNAKNSPWVAKEIELFRELHPMRPILAALVEGEPEDAFPQALIKAGEPLAADLRKQGDGWRLGLLKLIAGVAEVPLDALVQRDAQRHIRSVMAITLTVGIALLAMIGMTLFAIQQRNEAQHQQAQAEGLIEYMLTDLRSELKGVGRLDIMTNVNERALDYYEEQGPLENLSADSLLKRARVIHGLADNDEKRGDKDRAQELFVQTYQATKSLLKKSPNDPDHIFTHGQSEFYFGHMAYLRKDWSVTGVHWLEYKKLADQLVAQDQRDAKWLRESGYAEGNLCTLALAQKDQQLGLKLCEKSVDVMEQALKINPGDTESNAALANRVAWLSKVYAQMGKSAERLALLRRSIKLVDQLRIDNPKNRDLIDLWLAFQIELMPLDENRTEAQLNAAIKVARKQVAHDLRNRLWKRRLLELKAIN